MSIVVIYTFAAVIGLARKATGVLIPAMGLDTHWISPATVPAPAPAVLDHHDSLTQLSAAEAGQSNEPTHMTTASSNLAASRHDTDEQSAMQAADAVLVKDHHVIPAQQKRQESKADQELKMCKQELEHARQQLAAVQSEAAKTAAVWESLAVQLKDRLKDQVIAREHADYHVFYVQEELGKVRRILERSAMAAAIHIHNVEHEVLHSRASITALTDKIETLEQDKTRLANDLNHTRHLLSGAYEAQRQGTAKISAMQAEATTSAAKLKAAEYEAHKLGMYLDMATKMDAMDLKQAHAKFTAERRLLVTALSDIALGGLRARRQLAVARDMANAFSRDARGLREMDGMQKETLENVIADKGQLAKRIEELETQACAASSDPAPAAVA